MANVTPLMQGDQPSGFMSVRTEARRDQIQAAEALGWSLVWRTRVALAGSVIFRRNLPTGTLQLLQRQAKLRFFVRCASCFLALHYGEHQQSFFSASGDLTGLHPLRIAKKFERSVEILSAIKDREDFNFHFGFTVDFAR